MNYTVFEQCHCKPDRLRCVRAHEVGMPSPAWSSDKHAKTLWPGAFRCVSGDQLDTPLGAVRGRDIAALTRAIARLHGAAYCDRALTEACETGFLEAVRVLFGRASPAWNSRYACIRSAENGHTRVALFLLRNSLPKLQDRCGTGAHRASLGGHIETTRALIRFQLSMRLSEKRQRRFLTVSSCRIGDARLTKLLLESFEGCCATSLQVAIGNGQMECAALIWERMDHSSQQLKRYFKPKEAAEMDAWNDRASLQRVSSTSQLQAASYRRL